MTILSIGKTTYDSIIPVDNYPAENTKTIVTEKLEGSGGVACNVAHLLGKWNTEPYFAGIVGYDEFGSTIRKELDAEHVSTTYLEINYENKTTTTFVINNKSNTSRTQLMIEPQVYHLKRYDYDLSPNIIYSDGFEYSATMAAVNKFKTVPLVLGAGLGYGDTKEILVLAKYAKYIVFSRDFAEQLTKMKIDPTNANSMLNLYKALKERFNEQEVVVTLGANGVLYSVSNNVQYMPTIPVKEVDRTAAGDIFDGAFVYSLGKGYDIEKCMRIANIAAGLSTTKMGGKDSIPLLSDVIQYYESRFGPLESVGESNPAVQTPAQVNTMVATSNETVSNETNSATSMQDTSAPSNQAQS